MGAARALLVVCLVAAGACSPAQTTLARGNRPPAPKTREPDAETLPDTSIFGMPSIWRGGPGAHFDDAPIRRESDASPNAPTCGHDAVGRTSGTTDVVRVGDDDTHGLMPFCVSEPGVVTFAACADASWKNAFFLLRIYAAEAVHSRAPNMHDTRLGALIASSDDVVRFDHGGDEGGQWTCQPPYQTGGLQSNVGHHLEVGCYELAVEGFVDGHAPSGGGSYVVHAACSEAVIAEPPKPTRVASNVDHEQLGTHGANVPGVQDDPTGVQTIDIKVNIYSGAPCQKMLLTGGAGSGSMRLTASNLIEFKQNNDQRYITPGAPKDAPPENLWCVRPGMKLKLNHGASNAEIIQVDSVEATAFTLVEPLRFRHDPGEAVVEWCFGGWWVVLLFFASVAAYILFRVCGVGRKKTTGSLH